MFVSVIIPVYNQKESLAVTLRLLSWQDIPKTEYEIVLVDDGSTDGLKEWVEEGKFAYLGECFNYVRQENRGRAVTRNAAISHAKGDLFIFCDADRFPEEKMIKKYIKAYEGKKKTFLIGCPMDFYGVNKFLTEVKEEFDWNKIRKFSRIPLYYRQVSKLFDERGKTESSIAWIASLVGNSCISRNCIEKAGGFDEEFMEWGFEHFELGFRLQQREICFQVCPDICNFHIPHPRGNGYYEKMISSSIEVFQNKHPGYPISYLKDFILGTMSLQEFEKKFGGKVTESIQQEELIFNKIR